MMYSKREIEEAARRFMRIRRQGYDNSFTLEHYLERPATYELSFRVLLKRWQGREIIGQPINLN